MFEDSNFFDGIEYRTREEMLCEITARWLSNDGARNAADIHDYLTQNTDIAIAQTIVSNWPFENADAMELRPYITLCRRISAATLAK